MSRSLFLLPFALLFLIPADADAARMWSSGCEFQGDTGGNMDSKAGGNNLEWEAITGTSADSSQISTSIKRSGLSSCRNVRATEGSAAFEHQFIGTATTSDIYIRLYFYIASAPSEDAQIINVWDKGVDANEGTLVLESDLTMTWRDDDETVVGTYSTPLSTETWYRIEINYDAADAVVVRLDGSDIITVGAHDGDAVDTSFISPCAGTTLCGGGSTTFDFYYDDFAWNDATGSAQNSWPGAASIVHMQPDGAGDNNGCSAGDSTSVDEVTPDDGTSICVLDANTGGDILDVAVESSSNAGIDSYDTVNLVQIGLRSACASAAACVANPRVKSASGGTTTSGSNTSLSTTTYWTHDDTAPRNYLLTSYTDPTTGIAWTPTGTNSLDNMQIGANASDGNPDVNMSTIWALVEYVDGTAPASSPALQDDGHWFLLLDS